jgi:hypothetical protein
MPDHAAMLENAMPLDASRTAGYVYEIDMVDEGGVKMEPKLDAKTAELLSIEIDEDDEDEVAEAESDEEDE